MRYISEQFKAKQNQIIRPPLKLYFEVYSRVANSILANISFTESFFDTDYVPIVRPDNCSNEHYYAVVGDGMPVDDPNRICAPNFYGTMPKISVPYGITPYVSAGTEYTIGDDTYYKNFVGIPFGGVLSFKGGVIPERVTVERYEYSSSSWVVEQTINNPNLNEEITFTTSSIADSGKYRRFKVYSSSAGRYQLNWIKGIYSYLDSVSFDNKNIVSVEVNEETDLTSQALPTYDMTVVCLDIDGTYNPDSEYWNKQFAIGQPCYLKCGYEVVGKTEYVPLMLGLIKETPKYEQNKITFKIAVSWKAISLVTNFKSLVNSELEPGDIVDNKLFKDIVPSLFTTYDVFHGEVDERGSECNYYGIVDNNEVRQLVANAMGCFITAGIDTVDLHNTNDIQYNTFDNSYLTRYEQSKLVLNNMPKVGKIRVIRNEYTLSANYYEKEAEEAIEMPQGTAVTFEFILPFWAFGKYELIDAQSSDPDATLTILSFTELAKSDGTTEVGMRISSDVAITAQPIIRFYEVDRAEFEETETVENSDEEYVNDNYLVANGYNAGKVKRVAEFMSNVSNEYEIDVIQDFSREIGDIIRLETEKNVYKTCVITGLKFTLPGSKGHITCRKVFSPIDSEYYQSDVKTDQVFLYDDSGSGYSYKIVQLKYSGCLIGRMTFTNGGARTYYVVLGAQWISVNDTSMLGHIDITDDNKHVWRATPILTYNAECIYPSLDLGSYDSAAPVNDEATFASMTLIMKLYEDQNMTSPVNYESSYS